MALVPAGGGDYSQFDEDGFDFGDEEQGEEIDTVNRLPEPTLAQVDVACRRSMSILKLHHSFVLLCTGVCCI